MDSTAFIIILPSLVAGFLGWFVGDTHGFERAVACVKSMPMVSVPDEDTDGLGGLFERARR